ncbi:MAG: SCO family protein, partial [Nitrospirae bacterium]|nr:SCO family protein [Nitrospirota bacterium]
MAISKLTTILTFHYDDVMNEKEKSLNAGTAIKKLRFAFLGMVLLVLGISIGKSFNTVSFLIGTDEFLSATVLNVPVPLPEFSLIDHNGQEFTPSSFNRKWTFMFFGYIYCPDICPAALIDLNDVYQNLVEKNDLIEKKFQIGTQVVFVTMDPQRDSPEELKKYVPYFNNASIGLTGKSEMIDLLARPLGVGYRREPDNNSKDYLIDHSASFLLIDPLGRLRAIFSQPHNPRQIADDFRKIRKKFTAECCITGKKKLETVIFD